MEWLCPGHTGQSVGCCRGLRSDRESKMVYPPHIGYVTKEEYKILISKIFDQIAAHADGNPINVVNAEVL